jgi:hypothetical protein
MPIVRDIVEEEEEEGEEEEKPTDHNFAPRLSR